MAITTAATPIDVITTVFEHLDRHDLEGLEALIAEDVKEEWPIVGQIEGRQAVADHFRSLFSAMPDMRFEVLQMASVGDTVFVHWRVTATFSGAPFAGIRATRRPIDLRGTDCFTVRDGKVVANFIAFDGMGFAMQAGVLPRHGSVGDRMMTSTVNARTRVKELLHL